MKALLNAQTLRRIIAATKGFASLPGSNRAYTEYIKLEFRKDGSTVTAMAIDGYRLSVEHAVCGEVDEDFDAYVKPILPPLGRNQWAEISVANKTCYINVGGLISGFTQPDAVDFDYQKAIDDNRKGDPSLRIGFNGEYLLSALQAAKVSNGGSFKSPVILEFRSPTSPAFVTSNNGKDVKMVLPVRIFED